MKCIVSAAVLQGARELSNQLSIPSDRLLQHACLSEAVSQMLSCGGFHYLQHMAQGINNNSLNKSSHNEYNKYTQNNKSN